MPNSTLPGGAMAILAGALLTLAACQPAQRAHDKPMSDEQVKAYEECLRANQAVATAWENIERSCREEVTGSARLPR